MLESSTPSSATIGNSLSDTSLTALETKKTVSWIFWGLSTLQLGLGPSVQPETIANCYVHTQVLPTPVSDALKATSDPQKKASEDLMNLSELMNSLEVDANAEEYSTVDDNFIPEIESESVSESESVEIDDSNEVTRITSSELAESLKKVHTWLLQQETNLSEEVVAFMDMRKKIELHLESTKKQRSIKDFFTAQ